MNDIEQHGESQSNPGANADVTPTGEAPPARPMTKRSLLFLLALAGLGLALDLGTKIWAVAALADGSTMVVTEGVLSFRVAYNPGGAFSMFAGADALPRNLFFVVVSIVAVYFIVRLYSRLAPEQHALRWGLPLVMAGALGNLIDRLLRGHVVDFIEYRSGWVESLNGFINSIYSGWTVSDQWPTFNVADIWICVGVVLMLLDAWRPRRPQAHGADSIAPTPS